jgi:hypothetical protein
MGRRFFCFSIFPSLPIPTIISYTFLRMGDSNSALDVETVPQERRQMVGKSSKRDRTAKEDAAEKQVKVVETKK